MATSFSDLAAQLDAEADARLGDSILYAVDGANGGAYIAIQGRIFATDPPAGFQKMDEARGIWRMRVAKVVVPSPNKEDRLQCVPVLGDGTWRPTNKNPVDDGRYWLVDLQRVS